MDTNIAIHTSLVQTLFCTLHTEIYILLLETMDNMGGFTSDACGMARNARPLPDDIPAPLLGAGVAGAPAPEEFLTTDDMFIMKVSFLSEL